MPFRILSTLFVTLIAVTLSMVISTIPAKAEGKPPNVVVTIRPLHSIAAAVMKDVGEPVLLMKQGASPHGAALRPSQRRALEDADLVVWVGPSLETAMKKSIEQVASKTTVVSAMEAPELTLHEYRQLKKDDKHAEEEGHEHEDEHGHDHGGTDPHIWLAPDNAGHVAKQLAAALSKLDPENKPTYEKNANNFAEKSEALAGKLDGLLKPVSSRSFLTLHDGFQYFEKRFNLTSKGAVLIDPERLASAKHIQSLVTSIEANGIKCMLTEPQFSNRIVDVLSAKPGFKVKQVDLIGSDISPGPDLYFTMIEQIAMAIEACLSDKG